jgi:Ca2+-binding RTX toxin-like protein
MAIDADVYFNNGVLTIDGVNTDETYVVFEDWNTRVVIDDDGDTPFEWVSDGSNVEQLDIYQAEVQKLVVNLYDGNDNLNLSQVNFTNLDTEGDIVVYGGAGNDTIAGTVLMDRLDGGSGDDSIGGFDDRDTIVGGTGKDTILGGSGNDELFGNDNNDLIYGGDGGDTIEGGGQADHVYGDEGADLLYGDGTLGQAWVTDGGDYIVGGSDTFSDTIYGGGMNDLIWGDDPAAPVTAPTGDDYI